MNVPDMLSCNILTSNTTFRQFFCYGARGKVDYSFKVHLIQLPFWNFASLTHISFRCDFLLRISSTADTKADILWTDLFPSQQLRVLRGIQPRIWQSSLDRSLMLRARCYATRISTEHSLPSCRRDIGPDSRPPFRDSRRIRRRGCGRRCSGSGRGNPASGTRTAPSGRWSGDTLQGKGGGNSLGG